jgi:4'-phosphopantetheinyl transferase EntD
VRELRSTARRNPPNSYVEFPVVVRAADAKTRVFSAHSEFSAGTAIGTIGPFSVDPFEFHRWRLPALSDKGEGLTDCIYRPESDSGTDSVLRLLLDNLLASPAIAEVCDVTDDEDVLFVDEANMVSEAVAKRRREFAAGRRAAHRAMARLGLPCAPLLAGLDRAPLWPSGIVGSISHTRRIAFAAVANAAYAQGLGVDVEEDGPLPQDIVGRVCLPSELTGLAQVSAEIGGDAAKLLFSAKEAFYKSYYPLRKQFLDFLDVGILLRPACRSFDIKLVHDRSLDNIAFSGRFGWARGHVFSTVTIPARRNAEP